VRRRTHPSKIRIGIPSAPMLRGNRMLLAVRARDQLAGPAVCQVVSGSFGGRFVLLDNARGDAPAVANRNALVFRPGPDARAALTA
jgi:hypothetical protein